MENVVRPAQVCSVALTLSCAVRFYEIGSSGDQENIEQLIDETHLVLGVRFTCEAMASTDYPHGLEALDGSRRHLHRLKAPNPSHRSRPRAMKPPDSPDTSEPVSPAGA